MRVQESDERGSFTAWGIGFCYEYNAISGQFTVIHARRYRPLIDIEVARTALEHPLAFAECFERATQIQALMLSDNTTADMTEIFTVKQLQAYLENTLNTATMALLLQKDLQEDFAAMFCERYSLRSLHIHKSYNWTPEDGFYIIDLESMQGNKVRGQAYHLHNALFTVSSRIISDLIIQETANNFQAEAQILLNASSKLSTLSVILNNNFMPRRKIMQKRRREHCVQRLNAI